MSDYTMGGFWSSCIISGAAFLIASKKYYLEEGVGLFLICYTAGLFAFFGYMGFKKSSNYINRWDSEEIIAGFLGSALAQWVPVTLKVLLSGELW